ncbi:MAG: biopolymer transporter ExbD [Puniceicoccales bacterium]|jgi:biopolymer transport protein ExbD|nr:biopolymer transporter ExbD [Puniceicoccales bacterium]
MGGGGGGGDGEPEFQVAPMIDVLLVLLIFFMSITSAQVLKVDNDIKLPLAKNGAKRDDKAAAALVNISWVEATKTPRFKLDDKVILDADTEAPIVEGSREPIVEVLKKRKEHNDKFRLLLRVDKRVTAKSLQKALQWGAEAGIDNIAFSGTNKEE